MATVMIIPPCNRVMAVMLIRARVAQQPCILKCMPIGSMLTKETGFTLRVLLLECCCRLPLACTVVRASMLSLPVTAPVRVL